MSTIARSGSLAQDRVDERVGVGDLGDDVEVVVAEQPGEPVAQEREVLGDHDAHGSSARIVVGPPAGLCTVSVPSSASTRRRSPARPLPAASAPPLPSSWISTSSIPSLRPTEMSMRPAPECLAALAIASAATK